MAIEATRSERLRYRLDSFLVKGSSALFVALLVAFIGSFALLAGLRTLIWLIELGVADTEANLLFKGIWFTWLQLTAPGNMNQDTNTFFLYKLTAIGSGLTGVIIFSTLIAFLKAALDQAIDNLKKGHSRVLEQDHTLIIGWGPRVPEILRELAEANESEDDPVVVVLSEHEKVDMDEYLRENHTDRRNTRVVTRSGPTSSLHSLQKVSAEEAKSAIVLASCTPAASDSDKAASDAKVIKTVLALVAHVGEDHEMAIVAEVFDERNREVVQSISPDRVTVIDAQEILAKIMVQTSRTSGLSVVYAELLSFDGCEMYFHGADWGGINFGDLAFRFPDGVPLGVRHGDGSLELRTPPEYVMQDDDEIVIVAEDDSTIEFQAAPVMTPSPMALREARSEPGKERMLLLGWSPKVETIVGEYDDYVLEGSEVHIVVPAAPADILATIAALDAQLENASVKHFDLDPMSSADLMQLDPASYEVVMVLSQDLSETVTPEKVDSETIIVLLHLRKLLDAARAEGREVDTQLITEVLDSSNRDLIFRAGVHDFIISNRMMSMIFAQLSEEPDILAVYDDLFQEDGSEIYIKPASLYFDQLPVTAKFGDLMAHVRGRDHEICIGYKLKALEGDGGQNYGVKLIPEKDSEITLGPDDGLVVLAEDDG